MSKQAACSRCSRTAWLDICRTCTRWLCDLCFTAKGVECSRGVKHEKLRADDVVDFDKADESRKGN